PGAGEEDRQRAARAGEKGGQRTNP
ncbi:MAG: hypothetical protein J6Y90_07375, partial [Lachnospiraceae bacterium]|nr:hypothetical protein [Lachnospiraceae bacterium]